MFPPLSNTGKLERVAGVWRGQCVKIVESSVIAVCLAVSAMETRKQSSAQPAINGGYTPADTDTALPGHRSSVKQLILLTLAWSNILY